MHPGFPTRLSAIETQSSPSSFGPCGTTFRLGYSYTPLSSTAITTYASSRKYQLGSHDCIQKEPLALACNIANPFPLDLWGYVHGLAIDLISELVTHGKSLSTKPSEVSNMDLTIS